MGYGPQDWEVLAGIGRPGADPRVWRHKACGERLEFPDDNHRCVAGQLVPPGDGAAGEEGAAAIKALKAVGRPFPRPDGPNLCWCPESWSGPGNHTDACLQAFAVLTAPARPEARAAKGDGSRCHHPECPTPVITGRYDEGRRVYIYHHGQDTLDLKQGDGVFEGLDRRDALLRWYDELHADTDRRP